MAAADHSIALAGSAELVTEFFTYGVNTLLYQRAIYPPETFARVAKYGLTMLVSTDDRVKAFLDAVLGQMRVWLSRGALRKVVVVFASVATKKTLERWAFDVKVAGAQAGADGAASGPAEKSEAQIVREIQAVIRQITASVTFLPLLDEPCSFDMLIYTDHSVDTPSKWEESGPRVIPQNDNVQLRSFSTNRHNVEASVSYATTTE